MKKVILTTLALLAFEAQAQSTMAVSPDDKQGALKVPVGINNVPALVTGIKVVAGCYGTNNRYTINPLSPNSIVTMSIKNLRTGVVTQLSFPSSVTYGSSPESWESSGYKCGVKYGNSPEKEAVCMPNGIRAELEDADIMLDDLKPENFSISYYQSGGGIPPASKKVEFLAYEGSMDTVKTTLALSEVEGRPLVFVKAEFPGQDGFCGGFHSPLMMFFDKDRPTFQGKSNFLVKQTKGKKTYWPEKKHPGFFLVRFDDKDKSMKKPLLFGPDKNAADGFKALAAFDSNKDEVIDMKDPIFKNLFLWNDKNSDGLSQKSEVVSLEKMQVQSIQLKYDSSFSYDFGERAKAKGMSTFTFKKGSEIQQGQVYDIYMNEI